jgi:hypothetical protein
MLSGIFKIQKAFGKRPFLFQLKKADMKNSKKNSSVKEQLKKKVAAKVPEVTDQSVKLIPGNEPDVTREDLEALGPKDLSLDMGDDEDLKHRVYPLDFAGEDLDVPGAELDDASERIGSEDEENNPYSIGGDNHDKLSETNNI